MQYIQYNNWCKCAMPLASTFPEMSESSAGVNPSLSTVSFTSTYTPPKPVLQTCGVRVGVFSVCSRGGCEKKEGSGGGREGWRGHGPA